METKIITLKNKNFDLNINNDTCILFDYNNLNKCNICLNIESETNVQLVEFCNSSGLNKTLNINLKKNANLKHTVIILNSKLHNSLVSLSENSSYKLSEINLADNSEVETNHNVIHDEKETFCEMNIRNIAQGESKIFSNGLIKIRQNAPLSTGHQKIKGIILDSKSKIHAKPVLEIENNDVICSHSASISQINEDELFYLQTKGFNKNEAIKLIVKGYFEKALIHILNTEIRNILETKLKENNII